MESITNISAIQNLVYIGSSVLFILGIKMLGKEATAVKGNYLSALAMFSAVAITCLSLEIDYKVIVAGVLLGGLIGSAIAIKVKMTAIPEMVALFNGFGGLATFFNCMVTVQRSRQFVISACINYAHSLHRRHNLLRVIGSLWKIIRTN